VQITKEKVTAAVAVLIAAIVVGSLSVPRVDPVPPVPPAADARAYRFVGGAPVLAPEEPYAAGRDPFHIRDAWSEARPALLALPPAGSWPRALPGGIAVVPDDPGDRLLVDELPGAPGGG